MGREAVEGVGETFEDFEVSGVRGYVDAAEGIGEEMRGEGSNGMAEGFQGGVVWLRG